VVKLPYDLDEVRQRPSMYLPSSSFDVVASYLMGIDTASGGEFLKGFREWLVLMVNYGNNFAWTELVLRVAFPHEEDPRSYLRLASNESSAIDCLFRCLDEFLQAKQENQGLNSIFLRYDEWLRDQDWFSPSP
jgi:hypothetical protein